ncbi:MAG: LamG domain-containing protein, partial [Methylophagaceae bacterium]
MKRKLQFLIPLILLVAVSNQTFAQLNFAKKVIDVSREYYPYPKDNCAAQSLGKPNVYPTYGDEWSAWTPNNFGDQRDTLTLWFDNVGPIDSIAIYQTNEPGVIDSVWVKNPASSIWDLVYFATPAPTLSGVAEILEISFPMTTYNVSEIKIGLANDLATNYVEIDAVGIFPNTPSIVPMNNSGNSIVFDGVDDNFQTLSHVSNSFTDSTKTILAWVKVDGTAPVVTGVYNGSSILSDGGYAYFGVLHANLNGIDSLYFYNYSSVSDYVGMEYTPGEWMHIAFVHDKDTLMAFKNGVFYKGTSTDITGENQSFISIGYNPYSDEFFQGEIESVSTYNIALTTDEIREAMHVTPVGNEPGLTNHFNFNATPAFYTMGHDTMTIGSPISPISVLPIGTGSSFSAIEASVPVTFTSTNFSSSYSAQLAGEVTASRINNAPYAAPTGTIIDNNYFVVNQFSSSTFTADYTFSTTQTLDTALVDCRYALYTRPFNAYGTWNLVDTATVMTANSLTFSSISDSIGQFVIVQEGTCTIPVGIDELSSSNVRIFPNPTNNFVNVDLANYSDVVNYT